MPRPPCSSEAVEPSPFCNARKSGLAFRVHPNVKLPTVFWGMPGVWWGEGDAQVVVVGGEPQDVQALARTAGRTPRRLLHLARAGLLTVSVLLRSTPSEGERERRALEPFRGTG